MSNLFLQTYTPVLRLKQGEYLALTELAADVSGRVFPHFVLPPPSERDPEKRRLMTPEEIVVESGQRVGRHWALRPCMIDPRYLFSVLGEEEGANWLPRLFRIARDSHATATPTFSLAEIEGAALPGVRAAIDVAGQGLAIRLLLRDLGDPTLKTRLQGACLKVALKPHECLLVLDLSDADLDTPGLIGEAIVAYYQQVMEIGLWARPILEATSYPEANPAGPSGEVLLPRNEWQAWKHASALDTMVKANLMYGDFVADSAKFSFANAPISAIRHYRYSTSHHWYVVRAAKDDRSASSMARLADSVVSSPHFAGAGFSRADAILLETARGTAGPGNSSTWRKLNTGHHITRVVTDLGAYHSYEIAHAAYEPEAQGSLFD